MEIRLTRWQALLAVRTGYAKHGFTTGRWRTVFQSTPTHHARSAAGEYAVARWYNICWRATINKPEDADLYTVDDLPLEVRACGYDGFNKGGYVLVWEETPKDCPYIFTVPGPVTLPDHWRDLRPNEHFVQFDNGWPVDIIGWYDGARIPTVFQWQHKNDIYQNPCWKLPADRLLELRDLPSLPTPAQRDVQQLRFDNL